MPVLASLLLLAAVASPGVGANLGAAPAAADTAALGASPPAGSDYPEQARREYVDVCSTVNGRTGAAVRSCTCSIDVIASVLPFADYERAETVLRMRQLGGGYLAQEFRVQQTNDILRALHEAQAEAEVRCF